MLKNGCWETHKHVGPSKIVALGPSHLRSSTPAPFRITSITSNLYHGLQPISHHIHHTNLKNFRPPPAHRGEYLPLPRGARKGAGLRRWEDHCVNFRYNPGPKLTESAWGCDTWSSLHRPMAVRHISSGTWRPRCLATKKKEKEKQSHPLDDPSFKTKTHTVSLTHGLRFMQFHVGGWHGVDLAFSRQ